MRSTGEVLGLAESFGLAYFKAQEATQSPLPLEGTVLITVVDRDKPSILEPARLFRDIGFSLRATRGTCDFLAQNGIVSEPIQKIGHGRPDIVDAIKNKQIQLVINTPCSKESQEDDSYIRKSAIRFKVTYITTSAAALAAAKGIAARKENQTITVKSLQDYHGEIR
jgi:carbamoyl-phosphate synthase large subunit